MASTEEPLIYEFGGFRLVPTRRLLFSPTGQVVPLQPKVLDTLLYLVERPGQLVAKNTLMNAVWSGVVVEENGLNQHISTLRQTFGERPGENKFIVTVPGRGYVFAASVTVLGGAASAPAGRPAQGAEAAAITQKRFAAGVVASVAAATLVTLGWVTLRPGEPTRTPPPSPVRLSLELGSGQRLSGGVTSEAGPYFLSRPSRHSFALSPDGTALGYAATDGTETRLYLRSMNRSQAVPLAGTEGASQPFFSPRGENV